MNDATGEVSLSYVARTMPLLAKALRIHLPPIGETFERKGYTRELLIDFH